MSRRLGWTSWRRSAFASQGFLNLAELHARLGQFAPSAKGADQVLALARRAENKDKECSSLAYQAWEIHLRDEVEEWARGYRGESTIAQV